MSSDPAAPALAASESRSAPPAVPRRDGEFPGVVTRALSWTLDALLINLAAILAGLGTALVLSIFPLASGLRPALEIVAGGVYVLWCAAYFVAFWSATGQTPGARIMQIRLLGADGRRVRPARGLVRWVGMNLAMLPLFAGFIPILFRRRGFPDWLAHTEVLGAAQPSVAEARRRSRQAARAANGARPPLPPSTPDARIADPGTGGDGGADRHARQLGSR